MTPTPPRRPNSIPGRWAPIVLLAIAAWIAVPLGRAIAATAITDQDAAYYCHVAERFAAGDGLTALVDRRGPRTDRVELPRRLDANTLYPVGLGVLTKLVGDARVTGALVSLIALLATLGLAHHTIARSLGVVPLVAVGCAAAVALQREACQTAIAPLTDCPSLLLNVGCIAALSRARWWLAIAIAIAAVAVRFQNLALAVPLLGSMLATRPRSVLIALLAGTTGALLMAGDRALEGLAVFVNPFARDSLPRGVRFLFPGLVIGLCCMSRRSESRPFWLLAIGHLLVLLAAYDPSGERPWLFAQRHGLPFAFVAAAFTGAAVTHGRGRWVRGLAAACLIATLADSAAKPWRIATDRARVTARPELALVLAHFERRPLPPGAVVIAQDADVLARQLEIRAVHLRSHRPGPTLASDLAQRGITHAVLTWFEHPALRSRNAWMNALAASLRRSTITVAELADSASTARAAVLLLRP